MSLLIPIFVGGGEGGGGLLNFRGGGGVKKRESSDFRSPEVGISESMHLYSYKLMFYQIDPWSTKMPLSIHSLSYVGADFDALDFCCQHFWKLHLSGS